MIFWICLFIIELFLMYQYSLTQNQKAKKRILWAMILVLTYFSGFRDGLGADYAGYKELCERNVFYTGLWYLNEPLFTFWQKFCFETDFSAVLLFLISAFVTCASCLYTYSKFNNFVLAAFVFIFFTELYLFSFNIIQQFVANAIILLGSYPLLQNNDKRSKIIFAISIFVGFLIHRSSLIMFVVLLLSRKKFNNIVIFAAIIVSFFFPVQLLFQIEPVHDLIILLDYTSYLEYNASGISKFSTTNIFMNVMILPFLLNNRKLLKWQDGETYVLLVKLYALYLICNNLATGNFTITYRLASYFAVFIPLLFASLPRLIDRNIAKVCIIVPILILMFFRLFIGDKLTVPERILPVNSIMDSNYHPYEK